MNKFIENNKLNNGRLFCLKSISFREENIIQGLKLILRLEKTWDLQEFF